MEELAGRWSVGCSDTPRARALASREAEMAAREGHDVICHTLRCPVQGAWAVQEHRARWGLFVEERDNRLVRYYFDHRGVRCTAQECSSDGRVSTKKGGFVEYIPLSERQWARQVAREAVFGWRLRRVSAAVEGEEPQRQALRLVLQALGCRVEDRWRAGIPAFRMERGGFCLLARDERGAMVDSGQLLAVVTMIEMEQGGGVVALPPWSSAAAGLVAAGHGGGVLRLDRDGTRAQDVYAALPWLRQAPSAAARICTRMATSGQRLEHLIAKTPRFNVWSREALFRWDRQAVLRALEGQGHLEPEGQGFCVHTGENWLHIRPRVGQGAQIMAEGPDLELAEELCDLCVRRLNRSAGQDDDTIP